MKCRYNQRRKSPRVGIFWRDLGFSGERFGIFWRDLSDVETSELVNEWLQKHQPCLFGRIAARRNLISYCILTESDLHSSDDAIAEKVEYAHRKWSREAFEGKKSAFILLAVCPQIASAEPDSEVMELAQRLCSYLLLEDVQPDQVYLDEILLELPTSAKPTWRWDVGVNYFCTQGDKRWWHDHRIPGGLAFSINSVGHMVKSGKLAIALEDVENIEDLEKIIGTSSEGSKTSVVDSLEKALALAMRTIDKASDAVSGKATRLLPLPSDPNALIVPQCPVQLPSDLAQKDYCEYIGLYHTDYTLPAEYFLPDVERPKGIEVHGLDFTYLFHRSLNNPDFIRMGEGRRIRADIPEAEEETLTVDREYKKLRGEGEPIDLSEDELRARGLKD